VTGWLSYLGLTARSAAGVLGVLLAGLAVTVLVCRGAGWWLSLRRPGALFFLLAAGCAGMAISLLQLIQAGFFNPINDSITYTMCSEWLQHHGFNEPAVMNPHQPLDFEIRTFQINGLRMGATFLFALVQACSFGTPALELYPSMAAFGVALNLAGVYLVTRWTLRLSRFYGWVAMVSAGLLTNPLQMAAATGFMHQLYGTAFLSACIAILSRALVPCNQGWRMALLVAGLHAAVPCHYGELLPFLLAADLAFAGHCLVRGFRQGRTRSVLVYGLLISCAFLLFANYELLRVARVARALQEMVVGWEVQFDQSRVFAFLFGAGEYSELVLADPGSPLGGLLWHLTLVLGGLFVLGLWKSSHRSTSLALSCAVVAFWGLVLYYTIRVRDPITGQLGHRWNVFKLCNYGYPLILVLQVQGAWLVCRNSRLGQAVLCALLGWLVVHQWPAHQQSARGSTSAYASLMGSRNPLQDMKALRRLVRREAPDHVVLATTNPPRAVMLAYTLYPRPLVNFWGPNWRSWTEETSFLDQIPPGSCLVVDGPGGRPDQPWGTCRLERDGPMILRMQNPNTIESWDGETATWVGNAALVLDVHDPVGGEGTLRFRTMPGPSLTSTTRRTVRVIDPSGAQSDQTIEAVPGTTVQLPVRLHPGINQVRVQCLDRPEVIFPHDPRILLLGVIRPAFDHERARRGATVQR
jgi:hypothetical protein